MGIHLQPRDSSPMFPSSRLLDAISVQTGFLSVKWGSRPPSLPRALGLRKTSWILTKQADPPAEDQKPRRDLQFL